MLTLSSSVWPFTSKSCGIETLPLELMTSESVWDVVLCILNSLPLVWTNLTLSAASSPSSEIKSILAAPPSGPVIAKVLSPSKVKFDSPVIP